MMPRWMTGSSGEVMKMVVGGFGIW